MNVQEQVARLEALLSRVQRNAISLRQDRHQEEATTQLGSDEVYTPREINAPAFTSEHPAFIDRETNPVQDSRYESKIKTLPPGGSQPPSAQTLAPQSSEPSATELESIPPYDDSHEETKPLWVGLVPPPSAADLYAAAQTDTLDALGSIDGLEPVETLDLPDTLESSPPPSGERPSTHSPSVPAPDGPMSLEEPLKSIPAAAVPSSPAASSEPLAISTAEFDDERFTEDRNSRISDAPASTLGATITLPDEGADSVELELAEPPPSSMRLLTPTSEQPQPADSELEVDLPRTSYRAAYDDALSVPPGAREELAAHDENVRQRTPSKPAAELGSPQPSITYSTPTSARSLPEEDLPAVLSSRPQPSVPVAHQTEPSTATPTVAPGTAQVNDGTNTSVQFVPPLGAQPPEFAGAFPKAHDISFLGLLDASLALNVSE